MTQLGFGENNEEEGDENKSHKATPCLGAAWRIKQNLRLYDNPALTKAALSCLKQAGYKIDKDGSNDFHDKGQQKSPAEKSFAKLGKHKEPPLVGKSVFNIFIIPT